MASASLAQTRGSAVVAVVKAATADKPASVVANGFEEQKNEEREKN